MHQDWRCPDSNPHIVLYSYWNNFKIKWLLYFYPFAILYSNTASGNPLYTWSFRLLGTSRTSRDVCSTLHRAMESLGADAVPRDRTVHQDLQVLLCLGHGGVGMISDYLWWWAWMIHTAYWQISEQQDLEWLWWFFNSNREIRWIWWEIMMTQIHHSMAILGWWPTNCAIVGGYPAI